MGIRTALAAATLALVAAPLAGTSNATADGCVVDFAKKPYYMSNDTVTINPDGSVTVNPNPAKGLVNQALDHTLVLVACVV